jgi:DNA invertase Pin-like site-specific DNA recombinase
LPLRVSSESQVDGFGLPVQRRAVQTWAKKNGYRIVEEIVDAGVSGTRNAADRPGLSSALDMLRPPPRARGLIVARLDRLARSLTVQEAVLGIVWKAGGQVFTADGGVVDQDDADDPMRTAIRQVQGAFAQLERALVAKRMRDGRRLKAESGAHAVGQHPFGQRSGGPGRDGVVHDDERGWWSALSSSVVRVPATGRSVPPSMLKGYGLGVRGLAAGGGPPHRHARQRGQAIALSRGAPLNGFGLRRAPGQPDGWAVLPVAVRNSLATMTTGS